LKEPTRDGDMVLGLLTNLPSDISAVAIANAYPKRWQIETAFQEIEGLLSGEINTLGYPKRRRHAHPPSRSSPKRQNHTSTARQLDKNMTKLIDF